jgi:hypothetical protein
MLFLPAEVDFCYEHGTSLYLAIVRDCKRHRGKWTNLTSLWTIVHYQMVLNMDREAIFPPSGIYRSQQCYHSCLLWFRIITPTIQTAVVRDIIQEMRKVPQTQTTRQAPFLSKLNRLYTRYNQQQPMGGKRTGCHMCSAINKQQEWN